MRSASIADAAERFVEAAREENTRIRAGLHEALLGFARADGTLWGPSSTWVVTARTP